MRYYNIKINNQFLSHFDHTGIPQLIDNQIYAYRFENKDADICIEWLDKHNMGLSKVNAVQKLVDLEPGNKFTVCDNSEYELNNVYMLCSPTKKGKFMCVNMKNFWLRDIELHEFVSVVDDY